MDLLRLKDLKKDEINNLLDLSMQLRELKKKSKIIKPLEGKNLIMIFEKNSLRTRTTFEIGMNDLGGNALLMDPKMIQLGERETIADAARNFSRWSDLVMIRTFGQEKIEEFSENSSVPVINGLTDQYHPCQALSVNQAILINKKHKEGLKFVFVGDGNNVCNSMAHLCAFNNWEFVHICPKGYEMKQRFIDEAKEINPNFKITVTNDLSGADGANMIYTDVWASMGQEEETESRHKTFMPYQVNKELVARAASDVMVSHCLPAHRGEEITSDVLDAPYCIAFDEAECRLHAQKAVMLYLVNGDFDVQKNS